MKDWVRDPQRLAGDLQGLVRELQGLMGDWWWGGQETGIEKLACGYKGRSRNPPEIMGKHGKNHFPLG